MDFVTIIGVVATVVSTIVAIYVLYINRIKECSIMPDNVATRFIRLFESHGVHCNQIPSFFEHGLTLHDCSDHLHLIKVLDAGMIRDAAKLFGVNLEWLECASSEIYDIPSFYPDNEECEEYLRNLKASKVDSKLKTYVLNAKADKHYIDEDNAVLLIAEVISHIGEREIYRYHLVGKKQNDYWKARVYFAVSCGLLIKYGFKPIGKTVDEKWLVSINKGTRLIDYNFDEGWQGFVLPNSKVWYIDEFLECPEKYLSGVDPELDDFGHISALEMWLHFKDFMKIGDENSFNKAQVAFKNKLKELV